MNEFSQAPLPIAACRPLKVLTLAAGLVLAGPVPAQPAAAGETPAWSGTVGAGPALVPSYVGSKSTRTWAIPMISASYKDTVYLDFARGGVYLLSNADKTIAFGLAAEPRWGHGASDGARLTGMRTRRSSLEGGPSLDWQTALADFNVAYFRDFTHAGRGGSLRIGAYREFNPGAGLKLGLSAGVDRVSAKTVDYYFGVTPGEATLARPAYSGRAGTDFSVGLDGSYALGTRHAIVFGANVTRLNDNAAASPIVETRRAGLAWVGFAWNL